MRIGIDARCLEWNIGGPARHLINMLSFWPKLSQHTFILFFQNRIPDFEFLRHERFERVLIKGPKLLKSRRIIGEQMLMPFAIRKAKLDVLFAPWYSAPLFLSVPKTVIGCWDVSCNSHPSHYNILERISFGFFSPHSCRKAQGLLTCSSYDARQIEKHFGIPLERIKVTPYAADEKFKPASDPSDLDSFRRKYPLPRRYFLSMGIIIKRRNVDVVMSAFKRIRRDFPDVGLVVIGRNSTMPFVDIEKEMRPLVTEGRGFYLNRAPEEDIVNFYRGAWYYICTSTTDGESLMLKEAMKCGTPVITSPLLAETTGNNAVIINDPTSCSETSEVLRKLIPDEEMRRRYAERAVAWMKGLSWEDVARESLQFIESR